MTWFHQVLHHKAWLFPFLALMFLLMIQGGQTMTTIQAEHKEKADFFTVLAAPARSPEIPESADTYGWLVGSWELEVHNYGAAISAPPIKGEVHFARVLEGRAIQDVWIMPRRSERGVEIDKKINTYGTTLRVWDAALQAWRITWINGVTGTRDELIGRWNGKDIVQVGTNAKGTPIRWMFTEITPNSFRWTGEILQPDGKTWKLEGEFLAKRVR